MKPLKYTALSIVMLAGAIKYWIELLIKNEA